VIRAVIDTNILVSAMIRSSGNEALVLRAVDLRLVTPCVSLKILREYEEVLLRPKFGFAVDEVRSLLTLIRRHGDVFRALRYLRLPPTLATMSSLRVPCHQTLNSWSQETKDTFANRGSGERDWLTRESWFSTSSLCSNVSFGSWNFCSVSAYH
jgi:PIN domain